MEPWMEDDLVRTIPKEKLDFLSKLFQQGSGKSQRDLMRDVLPLLKEGKEKGLTFTKEEASAAISAIRKHSVPEEISKIDELLRKTNFHKKTE